MSLPPEVAVEAARARPQGEDEGRAGLVGAAEAATPRQGRRRDLPPDQEEGTRPRHEATPGEGECVLGVDGRRQQLKWLYETVCSMKFSL